MTLVTAKALEKTYIAGDITVRAIRGVDFVIEPASFWKATKQEEKLYEENS